MALSTRKETIHFHHTCFFFHGIPFVGHFFSIWDFFPPKKPGKVNISEDGTAAPLADAWSSPRELQALIMTVMKQRNYTWRVETAVSYHYYSHGKLKWLNIGEHSLHIEPKRPFPTTHLRKFVGSFEFSTDV